MIATSLTIPGRLKSGWWEQKGILRLAAAELLPRTIRRRAKSIQRLALRGGLGSVLAEMAGRWLQESAIEEHGLLTRAQLREVMRERDRAQDSREWADRLWSVLSLECWARHFLDDHGKARRSGQ
jgi:hypothetical protein